MPTRPIDRRLVCMDTETTGLDPNVHEIIEFACEDVHTGKGVCIKIKPKNIAAASPVALTLNGYNEEEWKDAISIEEALPIINEHLEGAMILGQNVIFDMNFIRAAMLKNKVECLMGRRFVDTQTLAYEHLAPLGIEKLSLVNVCEYLGLDNDDAHRALSDVRRTIKVYNTLSRSNAIQRAFWKLKNSYRSRTNVQ